MMKKVTTLILCVAVLATVCVAMTTSERQQAYADVFNPDAINKEETMDKLIVEPEPIIEEPVKEEHVYDGIAYLTFDDGPSTTITPQILDTLKEKNVKATFFVIGSYAKSHPELVKRAYDEGHTIGLHSYTHKKSMFNSLKAFKEEVDKTYDVVYDIIGEAPKYFRIPYGTKIGKTFKDYLNEKGLSVIGWNCESYDSRTYTTKPEQLVQAVKDTMGTKKEVTVIMHDTYGKQKTADALSDIIEHFNEVNYELKKYE